jgi:hypothetical protein
MADTLEPIALRWVGNTFEGAVLAFGPGRSSPELTYLGAPILADFALSYESLAPYVTAVLDQASALEGADLSVRLVEIRAGKVRVW